MKTTRLALIILFSVAAGMLIGSALTDRLHAEDSNSPAKKAYELRTYVAAPGKMADLQARFRNHTNALFIKHGMTPIGYWVPSEGPESENTLIYILAHDSREAAKKSWTAFATDPEWQAARKKSEENGKLTDKIESKFMNPTDYSPLQ